MHQFNYWEYFECVSIYSTLAAALAVNAKQCKLSSVIPRVSRSKVEV